MIKKLFSILALLLTVSGAWADDITVYFADALEWGDVYVYYWGSENKPDWPGAAMNNDGINENEQMVYKATIPGDVEGIIFTNGKDGNDLNETVDITTGIEDGACWYANGERDGIKYIVVKNEDTYIVAGSEAEIFGTAWDGSNEANQMVKGDDGIYSKAYTVDKAYNKVQLKVVKNNGEWIGDETGNNVIFRLTCAGTFTVVFDPEAGVASVTGDIVEPITEFEYDTVYAVGNGEGNWLNGASWDPAYVENEMTEIADGVWEITFYDVPEGFERQVKFAIDGTYAHNFGGEFEAFGVWSDAVYNGGNITFDTEDECNITITLDLSQFNFTTKEGAKFRIDNVEEIEGTDISAATVTGIDDAYDWTGSEIHPVPEVTLDGNVLSSTDDYDVTYSEGCTDVGIYTVTITGKGNYSGTKTVDFNINDVYFLVGSMTEWQIDQAYKLVKNEEAEGEYYISDVELSANDEFKVQSPGRKTQWGGGTWYPDGMDNNYVIQSNGTYDIYFRPNGDGGEDWFGNTIYVADVTPTPEDTYTVVGNEAEIFGTAWDASNEDNLMTKGDDGIYSKAYTVDKAYNNVQLKVVKNGEDWFGVNGNNVEFKLTGAGTFTVVFDPEAEVASVTGDIAEEITGFGDYTVYAVGNGEGNWLNGASWDPAYVENEMTEIADDVWEIKFENVPAGFERQVKFVLGGDWDDPWTHNFGWPTQGELEFEPGVWYDAVYNGGNITFDTDDYCTVKLTLDLSQFDFTTQTGAMFKIDIAYGETEEVEVALASTGYGTYYNSEKTVTLPAGVVAYTVSGVSGNQPTYVKIADGDDETNNTVLAATAVLLYCESKPETVTLTLTPSDDTYSGDNLLKGSDSQTTTTGGEKYYKLTYSNNNDNFGWYWGNDNGAAFVSPAHKAWLALPAGARAFLGLPGGEETGIITVQSQLVNDGAWYDLNGRRLSMKPILKGVYVNNGNKVVIR
jgi:hypothetical protein